MTEVDLSLNQVCESDEAPRAEKLVIVLENDNKETCQTSHLDGEITMIDVLA